MNVREALDVSHLPTEEYGHKDTLHWGIMGLFLIEGMAFALLLASYFYLRMRYTDWPPRDAGLPDFTWAIPNLILIIATCYPMRRIEKEAPERSPMWLARMLGICAGMIGASCVLRVMEFGSLNTDYFESSYGSITWALLFMHAIHLFTSAGGGGHAVGLLRDAFARS